MTDRPRIYTIFEVDDIYDASAEFFHGLQLGKF